MSDPNLAALVMAGGLGTRMRSDTPKHLHLLLGRRMLDWVLDAVGSTGPSRVVVVVSPQTHDAIAESLPEGVEIAVQQEPRGTGDAVAAARDALVGFDGDVLVVSGDAPLITADVLGGLVSAHRKAGNAATALSIESPRNLPYGRLVKDENGSLLEVVEAADATEDQLAIKELNASIYAFAAPDLWPAVEALDARNAQGELYLTDTIRNLSRAGRRVGSHPTADAAVAEGVNTRADLAHAAALLRDRVNEAHMLAGVTIVDPNTTWIDPDVQLARDAVVHQFTVLRGATRVAEAAEIGPHAVVVDAEIGRGAIVGPFCYLRPGTVLEAGAKAGTFVEIKNSHVGDGAKVPHLSYIGDAEIGAGANIAAGNITANFPHQPGRPKGRTTIGRNVRTGIHNGFIAPVTIGDDAWVAAGSVITKDVPPQALAVARSRQVNKEGFAGRDRD
ncbi:MAG: bifunctional UDP-N-acetylglucosamine diphosphorylase/glucosamine-1-phosphate N-acetyltransferase GlmU [Gaiellaceae bacterium]